jgi:O-antigen ligase
VVNQAAVFNDRVVSGLNSVTINEDTSVRARAREDAYALKAAGSAPVLGHGFGYAYQPAFGEPGHFAATRGQYYAHNFYLWLLMKTGAIGLLLMLWIMLAPAVRGLFSSSSVSRAVAATGLGLLTSMVFAPYPNDPQNGGSLAAGAVLGLLAWAVARAADGTGDPGAPEATAAPAERVPAEA